MQAVWRFYRRRVELLLSPIYQRLLDDREAVGRVTGLILENVRCRADDQRVELAHDCLVLGGVVELGEHVTHCFQTCALLVVGLDNGPGAVSYTHLDVYKRQLFACVAHGHQGVHGFARLREGHNQGLLVHDRVAVAELVGELNLGGDTAPAVSYTHLDVYKRQAQGRVKVGGGGVQPGDEGGFDTVGTQLQGLVDVHETEHVGAGGQSGTSHRVGTVAVGVRLDDGDEHAGANQLLEAAHVVLDGVEVNVRGAFLTLGGAGRAVQRCGLLLGGVGHVRRGLSRGGFFRGPPRGGRSVLNSRPPDVRKSCRDTLGG